MPMRAAIIVAHPDDEVIWAGGFILQHPDWEWTILSLCRADDADRAPKFERVCRHLGATGLISDLDDGNPPKPIDPETEIAGRIVEHLPAGPWDLCLSHGANGEYGHPRHKQVSSHVLQLARDGTIACRELWTFAYEADVPTESCRPAPWADVLVDLAEGQLVEKRRIVHELYGYDEDSFEVQACISPECFVRIEPFGQGGAR
jgi:LmbE family N-acetylglucosaminyl deacetylase